MSCKGFCSTRKNQLIEDSERLPLGLKIFLRAHHLLRNFIDFFKFRAAECCGTNYDKIPLHGALDVAATAMASIVCGSVPKKEFQRPGLFRDAFPCARCKQEQDVPDDVVHKVDMILISLQRSCAIENIVCQVKGVLSTLEGLPSGAMSERLRTLSFFLKEIMRNLLCYGQALAEPLHSTEIKMALYLVNNFIRDWSEIRSQARPCLKICRFCDQVVSKATRQWGTFCCKKVQRFNAIWEEWALQQSISGASKGEPIDEELKSKLVSEQLVDTDEELKSKLVSEQLVDTDEDYARGYSAVLSALGRSQTRHMDYDSTDTRSDGNKRTRGLNDASRKLIEVDGAIKHPSADGTRATRQMEPGASSRKAPGPRSLEPDKFDGLKGRDSAKTRDRSGGKARGRNIDRNEYPIRADGREERDDVPYRGKSSRIRELRGFREEGTAVGRMRKIKKDAGDSHDDRAEKSRSESERRDDRSRDKKRHERNRYGKVRGASDVEEEIDRSRKGAGDSSGRRKIKGSRLNKTMTVADDEGVDDSLQKRRKTDRSRLRRVRDAESANESNRDGETPRRGRGRRYHRRALSESERDNVGKTNDTDDEGKTSGRRGKRKIRQEETQEVADISKSKEARGRRKKKADALDSETKGVAYSVDEEENVLKRDGKRRGRSGRKAEGIDSELMKKHKGAKAFDTSAEDKSTLESGGRSKKETSARSKKGPGQPDSSRTDDDYSKINGSRYHKRKLKVGELYDVEGHRSSIEYQLSDQHFIQRGWTVLPVAKTMREIVHYEAKPAKPHLNWFERHKNDGETYYNDGSTVFLMFRAHESGEVFYPNGKLAIRVQKSENREYDMYTVFTPGGKDCMGVERESQIVAVFDTMGNGAVFDEDGATRLSYNQVGGIWRDNPAGLPLTWKWNADEKESIVATVYEEKSTTHLEKFLSPPTRASLKSSGTAKVLTSPASSRNKDKKVVERKPVVAVHDDEEEVGSGSDFHKNYPEETCHMPVICMKVTDYVSLRILDRRNINLQFLAPGAKSIRIELGTVLNRRKKVASYIVDSGSADAILKCKFDKLALSDLKPDNSLYKLSQELRKIKKSARQRKFMMNKYRPLLQTWKKSKTRCRLT